MGSIYIFIFYAKDYPVGIGLNDVCSDEKCPDLSVHTFHFDSDIDLNERIVSHAGECQWLLCHVMC